MVMTLLVQLFVCVIGIVTSARNDGSTSTNYTERLQAPASRTYFIAAIETEWDYAPSGINIMDGLPLNESAYSIAFTVSGPERIGKIYRKAIYRQFTDISFEEEVPHDEEWMHLGSLGTLLRGIVGERIKIVFWNNSTMPASMHPHGVAYDKTSEGAIYIDGTNNYGAAIQPGDSWVYFWDLRDLSGGSSHEVSSKFWLYHSHVDEVVDTNSGLIGAILITKQGMETSSTNLRPHDVDREFITLLTAYDENESFFLKNNVAKFVDNGNFNISNDNLYNALIENEDFHESNLMHAMNGFVFGSVSEYYEMKLGERVRWYVSALGTEIDIHTAHWHGNLVRYANMIEDVNQMMPGITQTMDMIPDKPGQWFYHCHVNDHILGGMVATYTVLNETFIPSINDETSVASDNWNWPQSQDFWPIYLLSTVANVAIIIIIGCCFYAKNCFNKRDSEKQPLLNDMERELESQNYDHDK